VSILNGSRNSLSSEINVTPMIDVLLVLLIIFMVVLPHHFWGERAQIPVPADHLDPQPPEDAVVIHLHDSGRGSAPMLTINHEEVAWEALENKLREIYLTRMDRVAFLKGDPEIDFQYVANALDTAHHAGVDRVGLLGAKD
jgi:biopolymer transport protein TolR